MGFTLHRGFESRPLRSIEMNSNNLALLNARGRMAAGAALVAFPRLAARTWIGGDASSRPVTILTRALGGRDLALGLGVAIALDRGSPVRGWLEACALADAVDLLATAIAAKSISPAAVRATIAIAGTSAASCVLLSRALDRPRSSDEMNAPEAALTGHPA
jgi:hypothetical protein